MCSDLVAQHVVLERVFDEGGHRLPRTHLVGVAAQLGKAGCAGAVDRAVRDLVRAGLLQVDADALRSSTAASTLRRLRALS